MTANLLIDETLDRINQEYHSGTLLRMKKIPEEWNRLVSLESEINKMALCGNVEDLEDALGRYKALILGE